MVNQRRNARPFWECRGDYETTNGENVESCTFYKIFSGKSAVCPLQQANLLREPTCVKVTALLVSPPFFHLVICLQP